MEIAKDRLRKSNYSTGQTPVDTVKTGVFLDPRIFEDPEPSSNKRTKNTTRFNDQTVQPDTSELFTPQNPGISDIPSEAEPLLQPNEHANTEQPGLLIPQPEQEETPQILPNAASPAVEEPAAHTGPLPSENPASVIDEGTPVPSFPQQAPQEQHEAEQPDNGTVIQDEGHNPWL